MALPIGLEHVDSRYRAATRHVDLRAGSQISSLGSKCELLRSAFEHMRRDGTREVLQQFARPRNQCEAERTSLTVAGDTQ